MKKHALSILFVLICAIILSGCNAKSEKEPKKENLEAEYEKYGINFCREGY